MGCQKKTPRNRQTLQINLRREPCSLDPRKGNDMIDSQLHYMLFEGLVRLDADDRFSCAAAESYAISPDGKTYTFRLRDTLWADGTKVTAHDFEYSWKRILSPDFPSPDAYLLYSVRNGRKAKLGEASLSEVGIRAVDEKTLVVELEAPTPYFLHIAASSVLLPVPARLDRANPNWAAAKDTIIGNGPFYLKEWMPHDRLIFEKNPRYRDGNAIKLDRIAIDVIEREMSVLHMFASGHFDLIGTPLSFFPSELHEDLERRRSLTYFPVASTKFLAFNTDLGPFRNANIRKAFALAISRENLIAYVTKLNETAALNVIPPALMEPKAYFQDGDAERAKRCLKQGLQEIGLKEMPSSLFMFVSSNINKSLAQVLRQTWEEVLQVKVTLDPVEYKILHERSAKGEFGIGLFAWLADYGDPINILERFSTKDNHRNYSKWHNAEYNRLVAEISTETSPIQYVEKVRQAEQILVDEMPFTCLFHENYAFLIHPHVKDFQVSPLGHIYFDKISIDQSKRN